MMKFLLTLLSIAVMAAGFAADPVKLPPKEKFLLVLLAGQSNMAGRGFVQDSDKIPSPRVVMLDKEGNWVPAVDPVHYDKKAAGVGPGRTFANLLAATDPEITVGLIPTACGGSPISSWVPGGYWEQTKSHPYDDAIARARKAMESGTLTVLLWHQGEADCGKENSKLYHDRFSELVKRFRRDLGAPELPVIVGQLSKFPNKPWWDGKNRSTPLSGRWWKSCLRPPSSPPTDSPRIRTSSTSTPPASVNSGNGTSKPIGSCWKRRTQRNKTSFRRRSPGAGKQKIAQRFSSGREPVAQLPFREPGPGGAYVFPRPRAAFPPRPASRRWDRR